ncbi:MAG: organic solvent tolerance protein OstA [Spirochaetes bacterium]|nr:MAG: organic solvent tolerance protein OstA [Spirochaetota bacterium]
MKKNRIGALLATFMFFFIIIPLVGKTFQFSGDRMYTVMAKGKEHTFLTGNATIITESTTIQAEEIELYGRDSRYAICKGGVSIKDEEKGIVLSTESLFFDREEEITRVKGYVEMIDQKNELVAKAGFLEHFGKEDIIILQIGVRILKEDMACRSEFARYRREEEILELSGMPFVFWKGDEYRASRIVINLDTDEIQLEGEVKGKIISEEKGEEKSKENDSGQ